MPISSYQGKYWIIVFLNQIDLTLIIFISISFHINLPFVFSWELLYFVCFVHFLFT